MRKISYAGYRFPPEIIRQAIWPYLRFTLSLREVEDLLAERGIAVSYETVRRWVNHFGPIIAAELRKRRPKPHSIWHLDEVYLKIDGRMVYLWRAVDAKGEVLDVLVQSKRNKHTACHPAPAARRLSAHARPRGRAASWRCPGQLAPDGRQSQARLVHKGKAFPGEHAAIVEEDLWRRVQSHLEENRIERREGDKALEPLASKTMPASRLSSELNSCSRPCSVDTRV